MFTLDESPSQRQERISKAIEFAGKYVRSFDRELLDHWYRSIVEHTLPPNATHAELAADNALRAFVVGILRQYQLAITGSAETPWQTITQITQPPTQPANRNNKANRKAFLTRRALSKARQSGSGPKA